MIDDCDLVIDNGNREVIDKAEEVRCGREYGERWSLSRAVRLVRPSWVVEAGRTCAVV